MRTGGGTRDPEVSSPRWWNALDPLPPTEKTALNAMRAQNSKRHILTGWGRPTTLGNGGSTSIAADDHDHDATAQQEAARGAFRLQGGIALGRAMVRWLGGRDQGFAGRTSGSVGCVGAVNGTRSLNNSADAPKRKSSQIRAQRRRWRRRGVKKGYQLEAVRGGTGMWVRRRA